MRTTPKVRLAEPVKPVPSRLLVCGGCRDRVEVIEAPFRFLKPGEYLCGECALAAQEAKRAA